MPRSHRRQDRQLAAPHERPRDQVCRQPRAPALPWPPDETLADYGERCACDTCEGRLVGATVDELRAYVDKMDSDYLTNEDTYFLRYLETARDLVVREAQLHRYGIYRDISTGTDTYVRADRRVAVRYDASLQEVLEVGTVRPSPEESYPATIAGSLAALREPTAASTATPASRWGSSGAKSSGEHCSRGMTGRGLSDGRTSGRTTVPGTQSVRSKSRHSFEQPTEPTL
jgi:hypothetical protein